MNPTHNCIVYFCDKVSTGRVTRSFNPNLTKILGQAYDEASSPSESLFMFPTWDAFERASV